jgi:VanZ family protein
MLTAQRRNFFRYWLPPIVWTCVIFTLSSDMFSAEHTGAVLEYILAKTIGPLQPATFEYVHFLVRKAAHVTEYAILGLLLFRAWRGERNEWRWNWMRQALAMVIVVAAFDEFHQSFVPSRGSSPWDALLDTLGAALALFIGWLVWVRKSAVSTQQSAFSHSR